MFLYCASTVRLYLLFMEMSAVITRRVPTTLFKLSSNMVFSVVCGLALVGSFAVTRGQKEESTTSRLAGMTPTRSLGSALL